MNYKRILLSFLLAAVLYACSTKTPESSISGANPAAEGFDMANSDPAAVELADSIMAAMGGRENWDKTRFISWNFFGSFVLRLCPESSNQNSFFLSALSTL